MNFKKKILATIAASILSSAAWADNVLIIGGEGDSHVSVQTELEAAGHTVTYQAGSSGPTDLTGYQQVWDMRYDTALSSNDMALYDTFLKNSGYLYLSGEHGGFATRNNSISAFTSSLGGGTISVNGFANNDQTGNTTYFTGGATVDYAAAAIITSDGGRTLSQDVNGAATAKMWIGNAGDLGVDYNGTVIVVADINWTQGWTYDANNEDFLEQIIRGIVAGTVGGTISDNGVGAAGGGDATPPAPPAPTTFSITNTGETVITDTMAAGTFTGNGGVLKVAVGTTNVPNDITLNNTGMTFDNNGQTVSLSGAVSGVGGLTFANTGTGGSSSLDGTYTYTGTTNVSSGVVVVNNSDISSSSGINNFGTFTNNGTASTIANNGTFTNSANAVTGLIGNIGTFTNNGTTGNWVNDNVMNNAATGTMGNGTNNGTFTNLGSVGAVTNTGTFANSGTLTSINNSGTFVTTPTTLSSYTQTGTGSTVLNYGSVLNVTGAANLDGNLTMLGTAPSLGKYSVLTGNGVSGTFSSYNGVGVLRYTPTGVQIWVMPDGTIVQANVNNLANNLSSMNSLATGSMINSLGSDCTLFGEKGGCIGVNYGQSKAGTGDLQTAGVTVAKRIDTNWRAGVFLGQQLNQTSVGAVKYESNNPAVGGFVGWNKNSDGTGLGITASAIQGRGNYDISGDNTGVKGEAAQIKASYTLPINGTTSVAPYIGVRKSSFTVNGYTEQNELFPLTYSSTTQTSTDVLAGANLTKKLTDKLTGTLSLGVIQQVDSSAGSLNSTSDMGNYSAPLQINKKTSAGIGAGVSYAVTKNQRIGANVGVQQNQLGDISSVGVNYTVGF
jgi:hypothetical protein